MPLLDLCCVIGGGVSFLMSLVDLNWSTSLVSGSRDGLMVAHLLFPLRPSFVPGHLSRNGEALICLRVGPRKLNDG